MSSVVDPQPDPAADEIVAYLDGELAPNDCRRVENRLATDEEYRQQLHDLDRAWEALDALPSPTVDDGFARTTIELACVAAQDDLSAHTAAAQKTKRLRLRRWMVAGAAAVLVGFLAGRALVPNRNEKLLNDLPAIEQLSVLPYVEDVEFLRKLVAIVPPEQLIKDEQSFDRNLKDLEHANNPSLESRREWIQSLPPEQKAELADHQRAFDDLTLPDEQERMRELMAEIQQAPDAPALNRMLIAYGNWLSRHPAAQQEQLREKLQDLSSNDQADVVRNEIQGEQKRSWRHLSAEENKALRDEIFRIADENEAAFMQKIAKRPWGARMQNLTQDPVTRALAILWFLDDKTYNQAIDRLIKTLSPETRAHWKNLPPAQGGFRKPLLAEWVREAMHPKLDPADLEKFFASGELSHARQQELLDKPRSEMEAELKREYLDLELGIDKNRFREFGMPRNLQGLPGPLGPERPFGQGARREQRPDGGPNDQRPPNRQRRPSDRPPQQSGKQESI
jgi:anti-sigma-K factor RskA